MATHSSILTLEIPWTEKPGGRESRGSQGVEYNRATKHKSIYVCVCVCVYTYTDTHTVFSTLFIEKTILFPLSFQR